MSGLSRPDDEWGTEAEGTVGPGQPLLVSLHFLRAALKRQRRIWIGLALTGMVVGLLLTFLTPARTSATTTLLLQHPDNTDPSLAMATDVSLVDTRAVAQSVIDELDLSMTPTAFQRSFTATQLTTELLEIQVSAPSASAALERTRTLASTFLTFRARQLSRQADVLAQGDQRRIATLKGRSDELTKEYAAISGDPTAQDRAGGLLEEITSLREQVQTLQAAVADTSLGSAAVVRASHVVDPASVVASSPARRVVLAAASGLIGGTALGLGLVLFAALTSDRLRRREDVSLALAAPVRFSVDHLRPDGLGPRRLRRAGRRDPLPARELRTLVRGLESAITTERTGVARLALGAVDCAPLGARLLADLAVRLSSRGTRVFLVDVSEQGGLAPALAQAVTATAEGPVAAPPVHRAAYVPELARGPVDGEDDRDGLAEELARSWREAEVVLTLSDIDPALGVDHLATWATRVVLLVPAGQLSAERLRTTAHLVRSGGLELDFAMMTGVQADDTSLGLPDVPAPVAAVSTRDLPVVVRRTRAPRGARRARRAR